MKFITHLQCSEYFRGKKDGFGMVLVVESFLRQEGECYCIESVSLPVLEFGGGVGGVEYPTVWCFLN